MKSSYPLHEELASLARMKPPIYKPLLPVMSAAMAKMFPCKSDETAINSSVTRTAMERRIEFLNRLKVCVQEVL